MKMSSIGDELTPSNRHKKPPLLIKKYNNANGGGSGSNSLPANSGLAPGSFLVPTDNGIPASRP
jgi:hypothetical protein